MEGNLINHSEGISMMITAHDTVGMPFGNISVETQIFKFLFFLMTNVIHNIESKLRSIFLKFHVSPDYYS